MKKDRFFHFSKNVTSPVFPILKLNYRRKMRGYPQFSLWILIARAKDLLFPHSYIPRKNGRVLGGTVLNRPGQV